MKIIAGKYRGRAIHYLKDKSFRPTTSKVREAIFSILTSGKFNQSLCDASVLDLCCGSGAFSLEALSRGAKNVILLDNDDKHLALAQENLKNLEEEHNAIFIRQDVCFMPKAKEAVDIIFLDPPYYIGFINKVLQRLQKQGWLKETTIIIVEIAEKEKLEIIDGINLLEERCYGKTKIIILGVAYDKK